jgi:purine-nucleoside phosphorylase
MLWRMSQFHLHAALGAVAPLVLLPGDPNRATFIAENFLDDAVCYNTNRQLLGYTGSYRGRQVSVQTTGMGCPSLAIVAEELIRLGAKTLIRVGTTGIVQREIQPGELVIAMSAIGDEGTSQLYLKGARYAATASFPVVRALVEACERQSLVHHVGLIRTEDAFYALSPDDVPWLAQLGVLSVEMESSALFLIGKLRGVAVGTILVASNHIGDPQVVEAQVMTTGITNMVGVALQAGLAVTKE